MRLLSILSLSRRVNILNTKTLLKPMSAADLVSRSQTILHNVDNEMHRFIQHDEYKGRGIAVFTSGGDSQGMNAAVRAVVRVGLYLGCKVWFIKEGYQGLVDGGDNIVEASWSSVSSIIHRGGTIIGSARCMDFREKPGRLKAARNLVFREITNLVVIGGDGSLTGANTFKLEWHSLLDELQHDGEINDKQRKKNQDLHIVGLVGSIDNDFCGTDMTIGTDSALHRIMEAVDTITATAHSHQRTFIMEVMGRHCGYLGVVIANCSEADFVFIPEDPPAPDWPDKLCKKLAEERKIGRRSNIIVVSEGAQDMDGNPITGEMIKNVVVEKLQQDTRVTVLGHVQRGGNPSAFDRVMGCRLGVEAVIALMESHPHSPSSVVTLLGNQVVHIPLMDCVKKTKAVTEAMSNKDWKTAVQLRGTNFERNLNIYKMMVSLEPPPRRFSVDGQAMDNYTIAVMHIGVQACGMNAAVRSIVRSFVTPGSTVYGIHDGVEGLVEGKFQVMEWEMVTGWTGEGGALLGIKRTHPKKFMREIAARFKQFGIQGLIIVGGFDAYQSGLQFVDARKKYPELCIPLVVLPASTNNNVPGTNFTVGCDTALNEIMGICDRIRLATQGLKRHVFIIESMGGHCGYLATLGGIASGSDAAYIFEEDFTVQEIVRDAENMAAKMNSGIMRGILLKSDKASNNLNTEFVYRLFAEQGRDDKFTVSMNVIGQIQQGGNPSPFDRNFGIKLGARSVKYLSEQLKLHGKDGKVNVTSKESAIMIGLIKRHYVFTPLVDLKAETNFDNRIPRDQWWLGLRPLARILAKHISTYGDLERKSRRWMVQSQSHFTELEQLSFLDYEPSSRTTIT